MGPYDSDEREQFLSLTGRRKDKITHFGANISSNYNTKMVKRHLDACVPVHCNVNIYHVSNINLNG